MVDLQFSDKSHWLSLRDACRILDVSQTTLRQWADGGHLRVYRTPGGHRRFLREDVDAFTGAHAAPSGHNGQEELEGSKSSSTLFVRDLLPLAASQCKALKHTKIGESLYLEYNLTRKYYKNYSI